MILREMQRSKVNTLLCLLTVVVATGVLVAMLTFSRASVDATRMMMKDMGFNLLITPPGVDPARAQALDFEGGDMPQEYVTRLAGAGRVLAQHFVGKYQKAIPLDGCMVVLTGVVSERTRTGTEKLPMPTAYNIPPGQVFVGSAAAQALKLTVGGKVSILGKNFEVARVLDEKGVSPEDIRVFGPLDEVQALLGKEGRVNAIDALACQCPASMTDILGALERSIHEVLPDVRVHMYKSILLARHEQRVLVTRFETAALIIVMVGSAAAICGLTYQNVRQRRREIGVLRALGVPGWRIAALFLGKILAYSVAGAALGCAGGALIANGFKFAETAVSAPLSAILGFLIAAPLAALLFGLPPITAGLLQEAVDALGENDA
jgi:predicted lysophospholipase L1 biosynthesis ABC-type transport system permease subunit